MEKSKFLSKVVSEVGMPSGKEIKWGCTDSSGNIFWSHFWVLPKGRKVKEWGTPPQTCFQLPPCPRRLGRWNIFSENEQSWKLWGKQVLCRISVLQIGMEIVWGGLSSR